MTQLNDYVKGSTTMTSPRRRLAALLVPLVLGATMLSVPLAAHAASTEPHGLDSLEQLDRLPYLDTQMRSGMDSSFGRDGTFSDQTGSLYSNGNERFFTDLRGPGEISRVWATALGGSDRIRFYFDGEASARVDMLALDFFAGTNAPFRGPLVLNNTQSSGGWVSYLPMKFNQSVRISIESPNANAYLQANYQLFSADTTVTTFTTSETGAQDSTDVRNLFANAGSDPKPAAASTTVSGTVTVPASGSSTLLDLNGPRSISSLRIKLPAITASSTEVTDDGRAFTGFSQFTMAINSANTGVTLTRRMDFAVPNQAADIYIDGTLAGRWSDPGHNTGSDLDDRFVKWKDSTFTIPSGLTAGKSSIVVKVVYVSGAPDWNEFRYWARSTVGGTPVLTDTLDVFNTASETSHSYTISGATWAGGSKTFFYPYDHAIADLLNQLTMRITWDNAATPAVQAPLGSFFAVGNYGFNLAPRTLMAGIDSSGWLYMYFPMPFASNAKIVLVNSGAAVSGVQYEIKHIAQSGSFDNVGYFSTEYRSQSVAAGSRHDVDLLDRDGQGSVVGLVLSGRGAPGPEALTTTYPEGYPNINNYRIAYWGYIEGDEKIYVDGSRTPSVHGTGIEDFGNGGFGWNQGLLRTPTHGLTTYDVTPVGGGNFVSRMAIQRIMLEDRINFRNHIQWTLEHGLVNEFGVDQLDTLVYLYYKPQLRTVQTDVFDVGVAASDTAHSLTTSGTVTNATKTQSFEGTYRDVFLTDEGTTTNGYLQFQLAIDPSNNGVMLRNRIDQTNVFQDSQVSIDGTNVGIWRIIGGNTSDSKWKENDFFVPASATSGKSTITVRLTRTSTSDPISAYKVSAFTVRSGTGPAIPAPPGATVNIPNPDFESQNLTGWTTTGAAFANAKVVNQTTQNGVAFGQHGTWHYWGFASGGDTPTGSMRTASFVLGGNGRLDFLLGGGRDIANLNLALVRAADDKVLLSATGWNYEGEKRIVMDAREWVGTDVYLKATDNASGGWGHLNLDDFHVPVSTFTSNLTGSWYDVGGAWTDVATGLQGSASGDAFRLNTQTASNLTLEGDVRLTAAGAGALILRSNSGATAFYAVNVDSVNQRVLFWGPGVTARTAAATIALNTTYHLKVVASGSSIQVYWSGFSGGTTPLLSFTDTVRTSGNAGVNVWNGTAVFQNVTIS